MTFTWIDYWIMLAGALCAMSCALLGNFLVLRRMSLMGDAISHAVLPGLVVAFLIGGSRASMPMFVGAALAGVLTAVLTQWIHAYGKVEASAAMGVAFTVLFAIGLILIKRYADTVHLDVDCVLEGKLEIIPLLASAGYTVPPQITRLAAVLILNLLVIVLLYKELKISSFDPELATTLGINARLMHYLLMVLVAITTVASFEAVGSILVIAMLIVPAAAAHLLTDRLAVMIVVSQVLALLSAVLGHWSALNVPRWFGYQGTSTSGMMALVAGLLFVLAALLAPRHGVLVKALHRAALSLRIGREDLLGALYRGEEAAHAAAVEAALPSLPEGRGLVPALRRRIAAGALLRSGRITRGGEGYRLTARGREQARSLIRSHRLWESYLSKNQPATSDGFHPAAEQLEHVTDPSLQTRLDAAAAQPRHDPQGKAIPSAEE